MGTLDHWVASWDFGPLILDSMKINTRYVCSEYIFDVVSTYDIRRGSAIHIYEEKTWY